MQIPIDVAITPCRPKTPEIAGWRTSELHLIYAFTEPEIELTFSDGSRATFVGPIVNDFMRRMPLPMECERLQRQVWMPIYYPLPSRRGY